MFHKVSATEELAELETGLSELEALVFELEAELARLDLKLDEEASLPR